MRTLTIACAVALVVAACGTTAPVTDPGDGAGATLTPAGAAGTPGAPAPTGQDEPPPTAGSQTVQVTLTGGADAGTYTGSENPNCSLGLIGPDGWGVRYSADQAGEGELSSLQLVSAAPGQEDHENAIFAGTSFLLTVTIGPPFEGGTNYEVNDRRGRGVRLRLGRGYGHRFDSRDPRHRDDRRRRGN